MAKQLLSLCSIQKITTRDGYVGPLARLLLPFSGYWFRNGDQILESNTAGNVAQDSSYNMLGQVKPNVFSKTCCGTGGDGTGL